MSITPRFNLDTLPLERQHEIISRLSGRQAAQLSGVCRSLRNSFSMFDNDKFWKEKYHKEFPYIPEPAGRSYKEHYISIAAPNSSRAAYISAREMCPQIITENYPFVAFDVAFIGYSLAFKQLIQSNIRFGNAFLATFVVTVICEKKISDHTFLNIFGGFCCSMTGGFIMGKICYGFGDFGTTGAIVGTLAGRMIAEAGFRIGLNICKKIGSLESVKNLFGKTNAYKRHLINKISSCSNYVFRRFF